MGSDMGALRDQTEVNIRERAGRRKQKAVEPNRVGLGALGDHLEVIPLEVIQHATDSLDQLIVGKLVLTGISKEFRQLVPKVFCRVSGAASQALPDGPRVLHMSRADEEEGEVVGAEPQ